MQKNNDPKCLDLLWLILTTIFIITVLILSILSFNLNSLYNLSMPLNMQGKPCSLSSQPNSYSYLRVNGPAISDRQCTSFCPEEEIDMELGGLCMDSRVGSILEQTGQAKKFIQPKKNALLRLKILAYVTLFTVLFSLLLFIFLHFLNFCLSPQKITAILYLLSLIASAVSFYLLFGIIRKEIWIGMIVVIGVYAIYGLLWGILRGSWGLGEKERQVKNRDEQRKGKLCKELGISFAVTVLVVGFIALTGFEYLAFMSTSPYYVWTPPALYSQINNITYKQILLIIQTLYLISFSYTFNEFLISSLYTNNLSFIPELCQLLNHLGSICKLSLIRLTFCIPIFIFTLIKPLQSSKCANLCHCLCGYALNLARRFSLPILAYQSSLSHPLTLSPASHSLHYETHFSDIEQSQSYLNSISISIILLNAVILLTILIEKSSGLDLSFMTLGMGMVIGGWIGGTWGQGEIGREGGKWVRGIGEANRGVGLRQKGRIQEKQIQWK